jgi:hypothetical protein
VEGIETKDNHELNGVRCRPWSQPKKAYQGLHLPGLETANFQKRSEDCTMLSFNEKDKVRDYPVVCQTVEPRFEILADHCQLIL